jgi:hypothetical protein
MTWRSYNRQSLYIPDPIPKPPKRKTLSEIISEADEKGWSDGYIPYKDSVIFNPLNKTIGEMRKEIERNKRILDYSERDGYE